MGQLDRAALKSFFETGDKPTQAQFADFIDSAFNLIDNADSFLYLKKMLVPTAAVLQLFTVRPEFIPDPGPNKIIEIISAYVSIDFNSIPYTTNLAVSFLTENANYHQFVNDTILAATVSTAIKSQISVPIGATATQLVPNEKIVIFTPVGNPVAGNSDITCHALYKINDV